MSLTGDELTLNDKSYTMKDRNGNDFFLGKLIKREKSYHPFLQTYSDNNRSFKFEHMLEDRYFYDTLDNCYNKKIFDEVDVIDGGKKIKKRNKSRKNKSTRRKSTRRKSSRRH